MKKIIVLLLLLPAFIFSQQKVTLEDIWSKGTFASKSAQGFNVLKDGLNYVDVEKTDGRPVLSMYELKTGKKIKELVNGADVKFNNKVIDLGSYAFSPNEDKLLLSENVESVYRRSPKANYYVYDIATKK